MTFGNKFGNSYGKAAARKFAIRAPDSATGRYLHGGVLAFRKMKLCFGTYP